MNQVDDSHIDNWIGQMAADFRYPQTPDVRYAVRQRIQPQPARADKAPAPARRLPHLAPAWALITVLLLAVSLLLVPQVRAGVLQLLRAGGITIFVAEPTSQLAVTPTDAPGAAAPPATATTPHSPTAPAPSFLVPVIPVSLADAAEALDATLALPRTLPPYGAPQEVYVDDKREAQVAILVWIRDEDQPLILYAIAARDFATKQVDGLTRADVNGHEAFWIEGPHGFILHGGEMWDTQTATGAVLIWSDGNLTYRLEGAASLDEARQLAEALGP